MPRAHLLTSTEAAATLGISRTRLLELVELGRIKCITTNVGRLFAQEDVARALNERRAQAERDWRIRLPEGTASR